MLDIETRMRIDTARDILVGKVPDPKSQVEQITIALIYKFMDDLDAEAEEFGGERRFFAGDFARFGWASLMRGDLSGYDVLNLYADAITRMPENPGVPALFRDIFNNAYLPYRDPETLRAFLKVIDEFTYDHSERLGDAFEYLLSVLGSQGDAGQFRTPRHIIDFIVDIIDPKKDETILDPACGTSGFLISSYKHILRTNSDVEGNRTLTPDENRKLADNISGYDISPDMVRLSLVNMYLHGFAQPHIFEYDTLTSDEKWDDYADVILANPPFMSPKGGIRPHNRFSVKSKRSEVLFVDYMAEHLTPNGRAGIIVPEGIMFQNQNAHKQLRRMLVENYLVAVISLPSGVFNPYSGVKTSILILDKALSKKTDHIAFFKLENDGFDLGAQRREIEKNDLPQVREELGHYLARVRADELMGNKGSVPTDRVAEHGMEYAKKDGQFTHGIVADKEKIAADGEYNLSGERYRTSKITRSNWPFARLGEVFRKVEETISPASLRTTVSYIGLENITQNSGKLTGSVTTDNPAKIKSLKTVFCLGDILYGKLRPNLNKVWLSDRKGICSTDIFVVRPRDERVMSGFYSHILRSDYFNDAVLRQLTGAQLPRIGWRAFENLEIPLPPLEAQREIVEEIESYQRVIDGARTVIENWRPKILIDPEWPMVELGTNVEVVAGQSPPGESYNNAGLGYPFYQGKAEFGHVFIEKPIKWTTDPKRFAEKDDILMSVRAPVGPVNLATQRICIGRGLAAIRPTDNNLHKLYTFYILSSLEAEISGNMGAAFSSINLKQIRQLKIPIPSLETQRIVVAGIEAEQAQVNANRELVKRLEQKTQDLVSRVWQGE